MPTTIDQHLQRPRMLGDVVFESQRLSNWLPPDDWDVGAPRPLLKKEASGVLGLV